MTGPTPDPATAEQLALLRSQLDAARRAGALVRAELQLKSAYLADMAHALRTPLSTIIGFSQLLHAGKAGPLAPTQLEHVGDILGSARRLQQVIADVSELAKLAAGRIEFSPRPVELRGLVTEVRDMLKTLASRKRIRIDIEVEETVSRVVADPAKVKQVLYAFLSNAIAFTPDAGQVWIHAAAASGDRYSIEVRDTGVGIDPARLPRIFDGFQRIDPSAEDAGGGLGLALAKHLVESMGGTVGASRAPTVGSVFSATLPRSGPPGTPPLTTTDPRDPSPSGDSTLTN